MQYAKQHFISYGDDNFANSKKRIYQEARNMGVFETVNVYGPEFISKDFKSKFEYVFKHSKGAGYWIWKYYIISEKLKELNDGEFLIYCDAGCRVNPKGKERYFEYLDMLNNSEYGILSFPLQNFKEDKELGTKEKIWTTKELLTYFDYSDDSKEANTVQLCATVIIMKKNNHLQKVIDEYLGLLEFDSKLITDYYNKNQKSYFKDNRHDQSIFSLLRKKYGSVLLDIDETVYYALQTSSVPNWSVPEKDKYPFWATRIKH